MWRGFAGAALEVARSITFVRLTERKKARVFHKLLLAVAFALLFNDIVMGGAPSKGSGSSVENRRSQRILLRIQIKVTAQFEDGLSITEDTTTLEVNAHGALIALAMKVRAGQKIIVRNWGTAKEQECRVVHVRESLAGKGEVGIAFPYAMPRFWNVDFPPPDWTPFMG